MANTTATHRDTGNNSYHSDHRSFRRGLSWWSVFRAEVTCFIYFVAELVWMVLLAILLLMGIIVAVDHSFLWGLLIVATTLYIMERTVP